MNKMTKAEKEFELLEQEIPDHLALPFKKDILKFVNKFMKSGQSRGSAPYTAATISNVLNKLCMKEPLTSIKGTEDEWQDCNNSPGDKTQQNVRCSALFRDNSEEKGYYTKAIIWQDENGNAFTGSVRIKTAIGYIVNSQNVKSYPFIPKTFYIDVYEKDGKTYIKDESQLEQVWEHYDIRIVKNLD